MNGVLSGTKQLDMGRVKGMGLHFDEVVTLGYLLMKLSPKAFTSSTD